MLIISQNNLLVNTEYVNKIYIGGRNDTTGIRFDLSGGVGSELARYSKRNISEYVVEMIAIAWAGGDTIFRIPDERDVIERMSLHKEERTHVKTKQNRHGGS